MSLRAKLVEAGARAQVHDFDALELSTQRFYLEVSERVVDAFLDCLAENADEWDHVAMDKFPKKDISDVGPRELLAVLRDSDV